MFHCELFIPRIFQHACCFCFASQRCAAAAVKPQTTNDGNWILCIWREAIKIAFSSLHTSCFDSSPTVIMKSLIAGLPSGAVNDMVKPLGNMFETSKSVEPVILNYLIKTFMWQSKCINTTYYLVTWRLHRLLPYCKLRMKHKQTLGLDSSFPPI